MAPGDWVVCRSNTGTLLMTTTRGFCQQVIPTTFVSSHPSADDAWRALQFARLSDSLAQLARTAV